MSDLITNPALLHGSAIAPASSPPAPAPATGSTPTGPSFAQLLSAQTASAAPSFSKHAVDRLARRGVELDGPTLGRLTQGIQSAAAKGARNSVVFVDGTAFVASVQNNTVITAVTPEAMRSHVFTNIDSAVVA